jgi:LacI family transcriptional regulator, fructose operon transcriptional repressor
MGSKIKDVALLAGVSSATVSRALRNKANVRPEIQQRVFEAAKSLNYRPSRVARSLRVQRSNIIGLIISDIQNPFFTSLVRGAEDVAYNSEHTLFLCNSDEEVAKEKLYIELMIAEQVAGVIITPARERNNAAYKLLEAGISVVAVDRRMLDLQVDTVLVDNASATRSLTQHLIDNGHRRIGGIFGFNSTTTGRERFEGYVTALSENGIKLEEALVFGVSPKESEGFEYTSKMLKTNPPTALIAGTNLLAEGAIRAIRTAGLKIPDDITLAVFDNPSWVSLISFPLTVVSQPTYMLGTTAAELVLKRINEPDRPTQEVVLKTRLIVGD